MENAEELHNEMLEAVGNKIYGARVEDTSKVSYKGKLNRVKIFLLDLEAGRQCVDHETNEIVLPLPNEIVKQLFIWLSCNTDLAKSHADEENNVHNRSIFNDHENRATISVSTMGGYKSALKWYYKEKGVPFDLELDAYLNDFIIGQGYGKTVAKKSSTK